VYAAQDVLVHPPHGAAPGHGSATGMVGRASDERNRSPDMVQRWDFFSRSGMNVTGVLLLAVIASAIYALWDVAARRWFG
jgi:hypothetical protein